MCCTYSPCLISLANARQENFLGGIAAKIAQKLNTKTKFLEEIAAKIVLFEKKIF